VFENGFMLSVWQKKPVSYIPNISALLLQLLLLIQSLPNNPWITTRLRMHSAFICCKPCLSTIQKHALNSYKLTRNFLLSTQLHGML